MEDLTPLYNKEFYLAYLCGENVVFPIPDGNAERYLAYLCGMDVTIPDVPDGRTETYLAYKCGEDVVLPDPMYRIEYYLAKWCGIDCEVPEPLYRIEYWLAQLANSGELKTVTGNPISVSDALAKPAESLTIEILPQQSGSGDPSPDNVRPISGHDSVKVTRTGKNLLDIARLQNRANWDADLVVGGDYPTSSGNRGIALSVKPNTTYTISAEKKETEATWPSYLYFCKYSNGVGTRLIYFSNSYKTLTFTAEENTLYYLRMGSSNTQQLFDDSIGRLDWIQLELGSTATAYEPYTGTTYSIDWTDEAGTVYGGTLDVTTGVLTVTHKYELLNDSTKWVGHSGTVDAYYNYDFSDRKIYDESSYMGVICSIAPVTYDTTLVYGRWMSSTSFLFGIKAHDGSPTLAEIQAMATNGDISICYELATPLTYQLTPTQVDMLLGNNVLWNDVDGDMTLEYLADGPADDVDALQILLGNRYVNNGEPDEATDREALDILLGGNTR